MNFIDLYHFGNILNIFQIYLNEYAKEVTKFHGKPETMDSSEKSHHITSNLVPLTKIVLDEKTVCGKE